MDVQADDHDPELAALELKLRGLRPSSLPSGMAGRLEAAIAEAVQAAAVERKVLAFPAPAEAPRGAVAKAPRGALAKAQQRSSWTSLFGAAAAVALLGAVSAFWVTAEPSPAVAKMEARKPAVTATPAGGHLVPAGYGRNVREASDEGIVWSQDQVPHRRVRVVYIDKAVIINAKGERVEVERPRVEWLLVPEKMD